MSLLAGRIAAEPVRTADPWPAYLDALEAAVRRLDEQVLAGEVPDAVALEGLRAPAAPLPPEAATRRDALLDLLADVAGRAQARRDALAAQIAALPRRRVATAVDRPTSLGGTLDVSG